MAVWEEIVRDHSPAIWKAVYRLVGNPDDAADCVQETFLSAMRHGNSKPIEHWGAFLHRIATARALEYVQNNREMMDQFRAPLFEDKVVDFILELAKINDKQVSKDELLSDPDDED